MTREDLSATLRMLREHGVSKYVDTPGEGFRVEFFPDTPAPDSPKPSNDTDLCACKHHLGIQHVNGLCVEGCSAEQCNPEPESEQKA